MEGDIILTNIECVKCKSVEFFQADGFYVCTYCRSKYRPEQLRGSSGAKGAGVAKTSTIEIDEDILRLLEKIKKEPWDARKYANMILDIDPTNEEALQILN